MVPALLGTIVGLVVLAIAALWYMRYRTRHQTQVSRARLWAQRNSGSWAMKEQKRGEDQLEAGAVNDGYPPKQEARLPSNGF